MPGVGRAWDVAERVRTVDRLGQTVLVGARVRVLEIPEALMRDVPADEQQDLQSMLGEVFAVYEIDDYGTAWVEKSWPADDGGQHSHSLGLDPHEMELA